MDAFPSLKAKALLRILMAEPLGYRITRQAGSHRRLAADGRPTIVFAFHDGATVPGGQVRRILVKQVGLDPREARDLC